MTSNKVNVISGIISQESHQISFLLEYSSYRPTNDVPIFFSHTPNNELQHLLSWPWDSSVLWTSSAFLCSYREVSALDTNPEVRKQVNNNSSCVEIFRKKLAQKTNNICKLNFALPTLKRFCRYTFAIFHAKRTLIAAIIISNQRIKKSCCRGKFCTLKFRIAISTCIGSYQREVSCAKFARALNFS